MKAQEPSALDVVVIWSWALPLRRAVTVIPGSAAPAVFFTVPESVAKRRMAASAAVVWPATTLTMSCVSGVDGSASYSSGAYAPKRSLKLRE